MTASRPRAFVFGARGPATDGEWRWFPAIRWFAPDGRLVQTRVLGGYGGTWAMAATRAWHGAYMENLRLHLAQQARPPR